MRTLGFAIGAIVLAACGSPSEEAGDGPAEANSTVAQTAALPTARMRPLPVPTVPAPRKNAGAPPEQGELARVLERAARVTVRIEGIDTTGATRSGSGTFVSQDGEIVTASWVVDPELTDLTAILPSGDRVPLAGIERDPVRPIARAQLDRSVNDWVDATATAQRESWVVCAGSLAVDAADHQPASTTGTVLESSYTYRRMPQDTRPRAPESVPEALKIDCSVRLGMEGGPVLDTAGRLVGVILDHEVAAPIERSGAVASGGATPAVDRWRQLERSTSPGEPWNDTEVQIGSPSAFAGGLVVGTSRAVLTLARVVTDAGGPIFAGLPTKRWRTDGKDPCTPIAVRGELALLRCAEIEGAAPILTVLSPYVAQEVWSRQLSQHWLGSFVTGIDREPGLVTLEPQGRYHWGLCGTGAAQHQQANPPITLGRAFVFDGASKPGGIVVGAHGVPVGIVVAQVDSGVTYAVPLAEAFERFPEID
jgi:hypothetical protein